MEIVAVVGRGREVVELWDWGRVMGGRGVVGW